MQLAIPSRRGFFSKRAVSGEHTLSVAIVDDSVEDYFLLSHLLRKSNLEVSRIDHYTNLEDFLSDDANSPDVVVLDRCLPDCGLSESRIREVRAKHNNCGVILHTGCLTPSLRSTAAHEGAVAVIEKGTLDAKAIGAMVSAAAQVGPSLQLH